MAATLPLLMVSITAIASACFKSCAACSSGCEALQGSCVPPQQLALQVLSQQAVSATRPTLSGKTSKFDVDFLCVFVAQMPVLCDACD